MNKQIYNKAYHERKRKLEQKKLKGDILDSTLVWTKARNQKPKQ